MTEQLPSTNTTDDNEEHSEFASWLKRLQKESWELELLVTGFSIFLLLQVPQATEHFNNQILAISMSAMAGIAVFLLSFISLAAKVMAFNLILHIVLRAIWIGFVGLSSVFPEGIVFEKLKLSDIHKQKLQHKYSNETNLIIRLDQLSSTIFAFSFLIACYIFSAGLIILLTILLLWGKSLAAAAGHHFLVYGAWAALVVLHLANIGKMINQLTFGILLKNARYAKMMYYIDFIFGWLTLYHLYAPIYYILISNYNRLKINTLIIGYVCSILIFASTLQTGGSAYFSDKHQFNPSNYDDQRGENKFIQTVSLESDKIDKSYAQLFIRYQENDESMLFRHCPELEEKPSRFAVKIFSATIGLRSYDMNEQQLAQYAIKSIECISQVYRISIDGKQLTELQFAFMDQNPNMGEKGIVTLLPMSDIEVGLHKLTIEKMHHKDDLRTEFKGWSTMLFWRVK